MIYTERLQWQFRNDYWNCRCLIYTQRIAIGGMTASFCMKIMYITPGCGASLFRYLSFCFVISSLVWKSLYTSGPSSYHVKLSLAKPIYVCMIFFYWQNLSLHELWSMLRLIFFVLNLKRTFIILSSKSLTYVRLKFK